ncbi:MAG TPA: glycosyltransferase family 39 protein, partial [Thermoanaerobaculia bacterium]|nr:glycosyltransferase family 39 protein [Thermoanaerobaculia bacterium]
MGRKTGRPSPRAAAGTPAPGPASPAVLPAALLLATFAGMTAWTFRKWVDPFVDFGQTMEFARDVAGGKVPYRDVALLHGPLSTGVDALVVRLFGPTIGALTTFNLAVVAAMAALLFRLLRDAFDRFAATAGSLLFLLVFAFGQYTPASITNYVAPYTPEIVHGLALGLLAVFFASRSGRSGKPADAALAGLFAGFAFLTKAETSVAALGGAAAGVLVAVLARRRTGGRVAPLLGPFAAGLAAPPAAAFLVFLVWLPPGDALRAALGPWPYVLPGSAAGLPFFRWVAGTDDVPGNLGRILLWGAGLAAVLGGAALWTRRIGPGRSRAGFYVATGLAAAGLATTIGRPEWLEVSRPLPLVLAAAIAMDTRRFRRGGAAASPGAAARIPFAVFALLLLLKTPLASRLYHYGQFLSMPGFLFAAGLLVTSMPSAIERRGGSGRAFRLVAVLLLALVTGTALFWTRAFMGLKTCRVGAGANRFDADERGGVLEEARAAIAVAARP